MIEKSTFTVKELQNYLGIGRHSAYRLVNDGIIPSVRVGKLFRISKAAVDRWLKETSKSNVSA